MPVAVTRQVSPRFAECELTHIERTPIDLDTARSQHKNYLRALASLGCRVVDLPALADLPDSVFVEDTAVVLPEVAIITRPGAVSRRPEVTSIAEALQPYRELVSIEEPATLDGGDVLVLGRDIFVGLSTRSGIPAIESLQLSLKRYGYSVQGVELHDCLHLKSAVTSLDPDRLLVNPDWLDVRTLGNRVLIEVDQTEPFAANILMIGGTGLYPTAFPKTENKLSRGGVKLLSVDVSELAKAEGAVTCCSLILD
jgi:dimethylargininase